MATKSLTREFNKGNVADCLISDTASVDKCETCKPGFSRNFEQTTCTNMCVLTNSDSACEECHEGYQLDSNTNCVPFIPHCDEYNV